jgi:hypothetical protein
MGLPSMKRIEGFDLCIISRKMIGVFLAFYVSMSFSHSVSYRLLEWLNDQVSLNSTRLHGRSFGRITAGNAHGRMG